MLISRRALILAPALFLGACSRMVTVTVNGDRGLPVIHVTVPGCSCRPYVDFISIYRSVRRGQDYDLIEMWRISAPRTIHRDMHVRYGDIPQGFIEDIAPKQLESGVTYRVSTAGRGDFGDGSFQMLGGEVL